MLFHVIDERLAQRRRRRDRIPGDDRDAAEHRANRRGGIAVDDDLAGRGVHPFDAPAVLRGQVFEGVRHPFVDRGDVRIDRLLFAFELLGDRVDDLVALDAEALGHDADVDHVREQLAKSRVLRQLARQFRERNFEEGDVIAHALAVQRRVVNADGAGLQRHDVLARRRRIHADHDVDFFFARDPAVFVRADGEPRRQAGDVRREHVLAADGHAHLKDRAHQDVVGRLRAGAVDGGHVDRAVVDGRSGTGHRLIENRRRGHAIGHVFLLCGLFGETLAGSFWRRRIVALPPRRGCRLSVVALSAPGSDRERDNG